jgi:signal transduction histidine kinase
MSYSVVRLERAEADARQHAMAEERIRLALWRMDSALAPLLAQESARSYLAYQAFLPAGSAASIYGPSPGNRPWVPSPLLASPPPQVLLYFEIAPDGKITSPQVPAERFRELLRVGHIDQDRVRRAAKLLHEWSAVADRGRLLASLPPQPATVEPVPLLIPLAEQAAANRARRANAQQSGETDFNLRSQTVQSANLNAAQQQEMLPRTPAGTEPAAAAGGAPMTPLWLSGRLVLARRVTVAGRECVQGCLLDWPSLRASLLETIADLLPLADLRPATRSAGRDESRMLAALPVQLLPGNIVVASGAASPILLSLGIAWACVLTAAAAVAALLWGVVRLGERRAAFVSAVTHELRTPLTTFRLYSEMLAEGMVPDAQRRQEYLVSLRREADRLAHLVENVLSYARLERGRRRGAIEPIGLGELVDRAHERLAAHAEQAGMTLVVEGREAAAGVVVLANPSAVEQVLLNLVDNACKYAGAAADRHIHLALRSGPGEAALVVRDHGPGISASARRRMFRSFSKSARDAAETAPGIGLGLTLSRRLARDMGGDLRLEPSVTDGACFVACFKRT